MRKPVFCICKIKAADQLHGNNIADQGLCFCFIYSLFCLCPEFEISNLFSVALRPGWCWTWSGTLKTGFLMTLPAEEIRCIFDDI